MSCVIVATTDNDRLCRLITPLTREKGVKSPRPQKKKIHLKWQERAKKLFKNVGDSCTFNAKIMESNVAFHNGWTVKN